MVIGSFILTARVPCAVLGTSRKPKCHSSSWGGDSLFKDNMEDTSLRLSSQEELQDKQWLRYRVYVKM